MTTTQSDTYRATQAMLAYLRETEGPETATLAFMDVMTSPRVLVEQKSTVGTTSTMKPQSKRKAKNVAAPKTAAEPTWQQLHAELSAAGKSVPQIVKALNEAGYKTAHGKNFTASTIYNYRLSLKNKK